MAADSTVLSACGSLLPVAPNHRKVSSMSEVSMSPEQPDTKWQNLAVELVQWSLRSRICAGRRAVNKRFPSYSILHMRMERGCWREMLHCKPIIDCTKWPVFTTAFSLVLCSQWGNNISPSADQCDLISSQAPSISQTFTRIKKRFLYPYSCTILRCELIRPWNCMSIPPIFCTTGYGLWGLIMENKVE